RRDSANQGEPAEPLERGARDPQQYGEKQERGVRGAERAPYGVPAQVARERDDARDDHEPYGDPAREEQAFAPGAHAPLLILFAVSRRLDRTGVRLSRRPGMPFRLRATSRRSRVRRRPRRLCSGWALLRARRLLWTLLGARLRALL